MKKSNHIRFYTHADTDLLLFRAVKKSFPALVENCECLSLQSIQVQGGFDSISLHGDFSGVALFRLLGNPSQIEGWEPFYHALRRQGAHIIVLSGDTERNVAYESLSTVSVEIRDTVMSYLGNGGVDNFSNLTAYLQATFNNSDTTFLPPKPVPGFGIYDSSRGLISQAEWLMSHPEPFPIVGLHFYRSHWLSQNLAWVDTIIDSLEAADLYCLPVFSGSGRDCPFDLFNGEHGLSIDVLINTTAFAATSASDNAMQRLRELNVPVLQAICSNMSHSDYEASSRGLNALDTAMNVAMPEFDGRIITVPVSFKEELSLDAQQELLYVPSPERAKRLAEIAKRFVVLRRKPNAEKKVAFVFTNASSKASQIGNAVGLDAPASLMGLLETMSAAGYQIGALPAHSDELMNELIDRCSYDSTYLSESQCKRALGLVGRKSYQKWFESLPLALQKRIVEQWGPPPGDAYLFDDQLVIAGLEFGNTVVILQPPRGYGMDPNAIYHLPDLPPTHHYLAVYAWLKETWNADAIVHVGKHGTLEWLPGKGVGLSSDCFPDAFLKDLPLIYPFIINDPGEGAQAKRRAHAVIVDHLMPPLTTADTYGILSELTLLVDEYYECEALDPSKLPALRARIWEKIKEARLDEDLSLIVNHHHDDHHHEHGHHEHGHHEHGHHEHGHHEHGHQGHGHQGHGHHGHDQGHGHEDRDHGHGHEHHGHELGHHGHDPGHAHEHHDHEHAHHEHEEWDATVGEEGVPRSLAAMDSVKFSHLIQDIDGYLCELGAAQIRDGLHILGQAPQAEQLTDTLACLTRLANDEVPGIHAELAALFGFDYSHILEEPGARVSPGQAKTNSLELAAGKQIHTHSDVLESLDLVARNVYEQLATLNYSIDAVDSAIETVLNISRDKMESLKRVLVFVCNDLVPNLGRTSEEITSVLRALSGEFIEPGPSGAPSRGMAKILPTGKNFYSVDPRNVPSQTAWNVGSALALQVVERYQSETGEFPENVCISMWGTSAMRTQGDDVAQVLALLGVRPIWQTTTRRVSGLELIPLDELKHPRIDVTIRISGLFRDAFPHLIALMDNAFSLTMEADEPPHLNFVRKHYLEDIEASNNAESSRFRIFGSKPGTYGAGVLGLIQEQNWKTDADLASAYLEWSSFAYDSQHSGIEAREQFCHRLKHSQVAVHNQDNREHDIFDSDDYLQFHGGIIAAIRNLSGAEPKKYFGDTQNVARPVVKDLKSEALKVFRSRVVNPKWIDSIKRHGYKGGLELSATVDYLFGYDATANILEDWMYEQVAQSYTFDESMRDFLKESNPWALQGICERLLEAAQRGMWQNPDPESLSKLQGTFLDAELLLEKREQPENAKEVDDVSV